VSAKHIPAQQQVAPKKLLIRQVNWLGDAVMTIPAMMRLRESNPAAHITILTHEKLSDLWLHQPYINQVSTFSSVESPWKIGRRLKPENFDTALILPNSPRSALECWSARIAHRIGYERPWTKWLLTRPIRRRPQRVTMRKRGDSEVKALIRMYPTGAATRYFSEAHQSYDYLHLAAQLGASEKPVAGRIKVLPAEVEGVRKKFGLTRETTLLFGLNAGAEYGPAKQWPVDRFVQTAAAIHNQNHCRWLLFGTAGQTPLVSTLESGILELTSRPGSHLQPPTLNLSGRTSLREFIVLLSQCRVVLTNDSGPMHLAAAVGAPVIVPFGSTSPELTGPFMPEGNSSVLRGEAPCAPCFRRECPIDHRCMTSVSVEAVLGAIRACLD
jgi:heptosyltransferase-2